MPLQEIIDGGHAINVHLSAEEIDTYIACGDIGGVVTTDEGEEENELIIGLGELNDSGHTGIAWLGAEGDQTRVAVHLVEPAATGAPAPKRRRRPRRARRTLAPTPPRNPLPSRSRILPSTRLRSTVPVGGSVTWTNQDTAPHTATGLDREALQSGAIASGESFTQAFDTAGTFEYFCEFHPNMKGSIVVE